VSAGIAQHGLPETIKEGDGTAAARRRLGPGAATPSIA
jgi:hypothetical protein